MTGPRLGANPKQEVPMQDPRFEIVDDQQQGFHARYVQGRQTIWWTESYTSKQNAEKAVYMISANAKPAPLYDLTASGQRRAG